MLPVRLLLGLEKGSFLSDVLQTIGFRRIDGVADQRSPDRLVLPPRRKAGRGRLPEETSGVPDRVDEVEMYRPVLGVSASHTPAFHVATFWRIQFSRFGMICADV